MGILPTPSQPAASTTPDGDHTVMGLDPVETYFECITACSVDDGECVTQCVEVLREAD